MTGIWATLTSPESSAMISGASHGPGEPSRTSIRVNRGKHFASQQYGDGPSSGGARTGVRLARRYRQG